MAKPKQPIRDPALTVLTGEPGLSLAAKGLAAYVLSRPPRTITRRELFSTSSDPMPMINGAIAELVALGLVDSVPGRGRGNRNGGGIVLAALTRQPGSAVAVIRSLLVVAEVGVDQCGAVDLVMEEGSEPGKARCLGGACLNPTAGVLTDINSGICADHIRQADHDGGVFIVE